MRPVSLRDLMGVMRMAWKHEILRPCCGSRAAVLVLESSRDGSVELYSVFCNWCVFVHINIVGTDILAGDRAVPWLIRAAIRLRHWHCYNNYRLSVSKYKYKCYSFSKYFKYYLNTKYLLCIWTLLWYKKVREVDLSWKQLIATGVHSIQSASVEMKWHSF